MRILVAIIVLFAASFSPAWSAEKYVTIGTAGVTGVYYPAGGAICRLVKQGLKDHGIRCFVEPTDGSVYNLLALRNGDLDFAVVQSDWQYHDVKGSNVFQSVGPDSDLRTLFSLYSEPFTVIVGKNSGIKKFDDLKGKRVNIGNEGSGMRATMEELMKRKGWTKASFAKVYEYNAQDQGAGLCKGKYDAMVYAAGHPNAAVQEVTMNCGARLIDVTGAAVDQLIKDNPYYAYATIPGGMYEGNDKPIRTFGVKATFVASDHLDADIVYQVVKAVFDNLNDFKTLHPVFATLDAAQMIADRGTTAPLHEGALRYYREKGLISQQARR